MYREYVNLKQLLANKMIFTVLPQTTTWLPSETGKQFFLQKTCSKFFLDPETAEPQQRSQAGEAIIEALGQEKI